MLQVKYIQFSARCRKSHVKEQIQYEVACFCPFLATRCLHVAYDFRVTVYSQLSSDLPTVRLFTVNNIPMCLHCVYKEIDAFSSHRKMKKISVLTESSDIAKYMHNT